MMFRTCTVQVNLDFESEADMVKKFRVGLALQPITTALFANSPFREGRPSGFLSYRAQVWTDVDNARAGMLPWVFEDGMSFERYVDYALDVPMYFLYRDGKYIDMAGKSFRKFLKREIPEVAHIEPMMSDWADHLTTIFPEVRLKSFLEMRGTDGGLWRRICGMPALWVGLLYDSVALDACWGPGQGLDGGRTPGAARRVSASRGFKVPFRKGHGARTGAPHAGNLGRRPQAPRRPGRRRHERGRLPQSPARTGQPRLYPRRGDAEELLRRLGQRHEPPLHRV